MLPSLATLSLTFALFLTLTPLFAWYTHRFNSPHLACNLIESAALLQTMCITFAFGVLIHAHIISDFSITNVVEYSHTSKPLLYKITGSWGNHEGSMLLWVTLLAWVTLVFGITVRCERSLRAAMLTVQMLFVAGFLLFILLTSNPFTLVFPLPPNGKGLNPLLQDIGLALHPPAPYFGYVGCSLAFSWAIITLWRGKIEAAWVAVLRPYMLFSWSFLTLGIGLGSWWAYRELGWGGFWFWDPVENASLMPWLVTTALIHALLTTEKRETLKGWTVLLALLAFCLSLLGTFLVRSGSLTSVHSFANDPARGLFILGLLAVVCISGMLFFAFRVHLLGASNRFAPISRETCMLVNNVLFLVACATVMLGTLYPLGLELVTGTHITVGAPYFAATFIPILLPAVVLAAIAPLIHWKEDRLSRYRLYYIMWGSGALLMMLLLKWLAPAISLGGLIGMGAGIWLVIASVMQWQMRIGLFQQPFSLVCQNLFRVPPHFYGMVLAHMGAGILVIGVTVVSSFSVEREAVMQAGDTLAIHRYQLVLKEVRYTEKHNYYAEQASFRLENRRGDVMAELVPERRLYRVEKSHTTESARYSKSAGDIYVAIGEAKEKGKVSVRAYFRPFISWIWAGTLLMVLGGIQIVLRTSHFFVKRAKNINFR